MGAEETLRFVIKARDEASHVLRRVGVSGFGGIKAAAVTAAAGAVAALAAIGAAAIKLGGKFDDAYDAIRIGTGATGKVLEGLKDDFRDVVSSVPASFEDASTAVADLNTRLGLTGEPLQRLSRQFLELSRITGTDVADNVRLGTRLFGDWSIAAEKQADALDLLFRATQQSGIGLSDLMQTIVQFGAPLRNMGFAFEDSVAMLAKWEKEGVNTSTVLQGMRFALKQFAAEGIDPQKGFPAVIAEIERLPKLEAIDLGKKVFGLRAFSDIVAAIREGRFQYEGLAKEITRGSDTITRAAKDTDDWRESLTVLKNKALVALEPVLIRVFGGLTKILDGLAGLDDATKTSIAIIGGATAVAIPLVAATKALVAAYGSLSAASAVAATSQATLTAVQAASPLATGALLGQTTALTTQLPLMSAAGVAAFAAIAVPAGALLWKLRDIHDETMDIYADIDRGYEELAKATDRLFEMRRARPEHVAQMAEADIREQIMKVTIQTGGTADLSKLEERLELFRKFAKFEYPGFSSLTLDIKAGKIKGADLLYTFDKLRNEIMRQLKLTEKEADIILGRIFGKKYKTMKMPKVDTSEWDRLPTELERNTALVVKVARKNGAWAGRQLIAGFVAANKPTPYSVSAARAAEAIRRQLATLPGYGSRLGRNLAESVARGISSATETVALRAETMVIRAIARANAAADARSPSRKMMRLGSLMAEGLAVGMTADTPLVSSAAARMVEKAAAAAAVAGSGGAGYAQVGYGAPSAAGEVHIHVDLPGGTTLVGEAEGVGRILAPHVQTALAQAQHRQGRRRR